jgi:hypothetical protein
VLKKEQYDERECNKKTGLVVVAVIAGVIP